MKVTQFLLLCRVACGLRFAFNNNVALKIQRRAHIYCVSGEFESIGAGDGNNQRTNSTIEDYISAAAAEMASKAKEDKIEMSEKKKMVRQKKADDEYEAYWSKREG